MVPVANTVDETRRHIIYCHTNNVDGLRYVGQTVCRSAKTTPEKAIDERWGRGYQTSKRFFNVIRKYGRGIFTSEVLEIVVGQTAANAAEPKWIIKLGTLSPNGYNLDLGGRNGSLRHPETRLKMSAMMRERMAALTPEQRAAPRAAQLAASTHEQRQAVGRKAKETMGPERLKAMARKREDAIAPGRRSAIVRATWALKSPEERRAITHNGCMAARDSLTHEQRSAIALKREAAMLPGKRSEIAKKRDAARSPEERSERARNASMKRWAAVRAAKAGGGNDGL